MSPEPSPQGVGCNAPQVPRLYRSHARRLNNPRTLALNVLNTLNAPSGLNRLDGLNAVNSADVVTSANSANATDLRHASAATRRLSLGCTPLGHWCCIEVSDALTIDCAVTANAQAALGPLQASGLALIAVTSRPALEPVCGQKPSRLLAAKLPLSWH